MSQFFGYLAVAIICCFAIVLVGHCTTIVLQEFM
jgi:hypothetical protein